MLVRMVAEPAGMNCASGGQKVQLGADVNGNGQLDDGKVQETRYVCNGNSIAGPAGAAGAAGDKGAILTCDTVSESDRSISCDKPRVNGVKLVELGMFEEPSGLQTMNSLCKAVTGGNTSGYTTDPISPDGSFFSSWTEDEWHFSQNVIPGQLQVRQLGCFSTL
jgi:hypothetical protein